MLLVVIEDSRVPGTVTVTRDYLDLHVVCVRRTTLCSTEHHIQLLVREPFHPIHTMVEKEGKATQSLFPQADRDRPSDVVHSHLNLLRTSADSSPHKVLPSSSPLHHNPFTTSIRAQDEARQTTLLTSRAPL